MESDSDDDQEAYVDQMRKNLQKNLDVDEKVAKEKLREKRVKTKRKLRMLRGEDPDDYQGGE